MRNHGGQKDVANFSSAESKQTKTKNVSNWNSMFNESILQKQTEIKTFSNKRRLREFVISRPTPNEWLQKIL